MKNSTAIIMIVVAAILWGSISIYVKQLALVGFTSMEIVTLRCFWATLSLLIFLLLFSKEEKKLKKITDIKYFIGTGIVSIVFFNYCYFQTITTLNISIAVILLYTAPIFVSILSYFLFKEKLSPLKISFVATSFIGCILIAGFSYSQLNFSIVSLLIGLGAGVGYAFYTIFSRYALKSYSPLIITFYTFLVATVFLLPFTRIWEKRELIFEPNILLITIGLGVFPTVVAYIIYTKGLEKIENTKAAVIATIEPIIGTIIAVTIFQEKLFLLQIIGSIVIIISVVMVNIIKSKSLFD